MTNNDILRKLRYTYDFGDDQMISIFGSAGQIQTRAAISNWMKKDDDPDYKSMSDFDLAAFLNGFIYLKRGKQEGKELVHEKELTNNLILRKLKIALNLTDDDIIELFTKADLTVSKTELSALFRRTDHKHYRPCKDQFLRNFLMGLQIKERKQAD